MPSLKPNGRRLNGSGSKWITPARRARLYLRDDYRCAWCGAFLIAVPPHQRTLDLVPRRLGGPHDDWNLVTACKECNDRRNIVRRTRDALKTRAGRCA